MIFESAVSSSMFFELYGLDVNKHFFESCCVSRCWTISIETIISKTSPVRFLDHTCDIRSCPYNQKEMDTIIIKLKFVFIISELFVISNGS